MARGLVYNKMSEFLFENLSFTCSIEYVNIGT